MSEEYWKSRNPWKRHYTPEEIYEMGLRSIAMRRVNQAVKNGTLERSDRCQICGHECNTVGHHYNGYEKVFDVWWICRRCNSTLKNRHDGSLTIENARKIIIGRYFKRREHFYKNWGYKFSECNICHCEGEVRTMALLYDDMEEGKMIVCQSCASQFLPKKEA